jgi:hypothetical protein
VLASNTIELTAIASAAVDLCPIALIYCSIYKRESGSADQNMLSFGNNSSHDLNATKLCQTQFEHLIKDIED